MARTIPPCFNEKTRTDCPRRYIGCKATCEEWHNWLIIHEREKQETRQRIAQEREVNGFLMDQPQRIRRHTAEKSATKKRRGLR